MDWLSLDGSSYTAEVLPMNNKENDFNYYSRLQPRLKEQTKQYVELLLQHNIISQLIVYSSEGDKDTIFEIAKELNNLNILRPIIAHLAVLEGLGVSIKKFGHAKINSCQPLKKYFEKCRKHLKVKISGSITLLDLLTVDEKQMARYLRNKELILKLTRLSFKQNLRHFYSYYYRILKTRILKGIEHRRCRDRLAKIICNIFGNCLDKDNLVVDKIVDFVTEKTSIKTMQQNNSTAT